MEDPLHLGSPPAINALVLIAHDAEVFAVPGQELEEAVLGAVGVLVLIHQHMPEAVGSQDVGVVSQQPEGQEKQVVEIGGACVAKTLLVGGVRLSDLGVQSEIQPVVILRAETPVFGPPNRRENDAGRIMLPADPQIGRNGGDGGEAVGVVVNGEIG